ARSSQLKRCSTQAPGSGRAHAGRLASVNACYPRFADAVYAIRVGRLVKFESIGTPEQAISASKPRLRVQLIGKSQVGRELLPGLVLRVAFRPARASYLPQFPLQGR